MKWKHERLLVFVNVKSVRTSLHGKVHDGHYVAQTFGALSDLAKRIILCLARLMQHTRNFRVARSR